MLAKPKSSLHIPAATPRRPKINKIIISFKVIL